MRRVLRVTKNNASVLTLPHGLRTYARYHPDG